MEGFVRGQLLRIFIDEKDRSGIQPLYTAVVEFLRRRGVSGASVFRGIEGYGGRSEIHLATAFSWLPNLPVVIEVVEDEAKIDEIMPELQALIPEGLMTLEKVDYLRI